MAYSPLRPPATEKSLLVRLKEAGAAKSAPLQKQLGTPIVNSAHRTKQRSPRVSAPGSAPVLMKESAVLPRGRSPHPERRNMHETSRADNAEADGAGTKESDSGSSTTTLLPTDEAGTAVPASASKVVLSCIEILTTDEADTALPAGASKMARISREAEQPQESPGQLSKLEQHKPTSRDTDAGSSTTYTSEAVSGVEEGKHIRSRTQLLQPELENRVQPSVLDKKDAQTAATDAMRLTRHLFEELAERDEECKSRAELIKVLTEQVNTLKLDMRECTKKISFLTKENQDLNDKVHSLTQGHQESNEKVHCLTRDNLELTAQAKESSEKVNCLTRDNLELTAQATHLAEKNKELTEQVNLVSEEHSKLKSMSLLPTGNFDDILHSRVVDQEIAYKFLEDEVKELKAKNKQLALQAESNSIQDEQVNFSSLSEGHRQWLEVEKKQLQQEIESVRAENDRLQKELVSHCRMHEMNEQVLVHQLEVSRSQMNETLDQLELKLENETSENVMVQTLTSMVISSEEDTIFSKELVEAEEQRRAVSQLVDMVPTRLYKYVEEFELALAGFVTKAHGPLHSSRRICTQLISLNEAMSKNATGESPGPTRSPQKEPPFYELDNASAFYGLKNSLDVIVYIARALEDHALLVALPPPAPS